MDKSIIRPTPREFALHKQKENHKTQNHLRDVILGGQDGLVNALGIILGISAASGDIKILITTVLAATFAESLSMGAVAYTSALSQRDYYMKERAQEKKEIELEPEMEREEVRQIFEQKGFSGNVLEEIVATITADKKLWIDTMMAEELKIAPVDIKDVRISSIIVTIATTIGHFIPLLPFFFVMRQTEGLVISIIVSAVALFATGTYQAISLIGSWWESGIRMVLIGMSAAFIGYFAALLFHVVGK